MSPQIRKKFCHQENVERARARLSTDGSHALNWERHGKCLNGERREEVCDIDELTMNMIDDLLQRTRGPDTKSCGCDKRARGAESLGAAR